MWRPRRQRCKPDQFITASKVEPYLVPRRGPDAYLINPCLLHLGQKAGNVLLEFPVRFTDIAVRLGGRPPSGQRRLLLDVAILW